MDLSQHVSPDSDQLDAIDLIDGPRTFTVKRVAESGLDDKRSVDIWFDEFPRPWRPNVNQRRVLLFCWGKDGASYVGRRMTLFRDPEVRFGKEKPGGTRLSHVSHIVKTMHAPIIEGQGRTSYYTVEPLTEPTRPAAPTTADVAACTDIEALRGMYRAANGDVRSLIMARVAELEAIDATLPQTGAES